MTFQLYPVQIEAVEKALRRESQNACALAADLGQGKSAISIEILKRLNAKVTLIIAPAQTLGNTSATGDAEGWLGAHQLQEVAQPFKRIDSTKAGLKNFADYQWGVGGVYWTTHELFTRWAFDIVPILLKDGSQRLDKNKKPMVKHVHNDNWSGTFSDLVIFDEVHRAQSHDSFTFKALEKLHTGYKIGASGTFSGNSFDGFYAICRWLWPHLAEKNIYDWREKWAQVVYDHFAVRNQRVVGEKNPGAYADSLPCWVMIESKLDVEVQRKKVFVDLYPDQRKIYDDMEDRMVSWVDDNPLVAKVPMVKRIRMRQVTLAVPKLTQIDDETWEVDFEDDCRGAKVDTLLSILREEIKDEPVLVFTDSQKFARVLSARLVREGFVARERSGRISKKVREEDKQAFLRGDYQVMVATIKSTGTGFSGLQKVCRNMIFMSSDESRIENEQGIGRLVRIGQFSKVVRVWWLIARDTIDAGQWSAQMQAGLKHNVSLKKKGSR